MGIDEFVSDSMSCDEIRLVVTFLGDFIAIYNSVPSTIHRGVARGTCYIFLGSPIHQLPDDSPTPRFTDSPTHRFPNAAYWFSEVFMVFIS
ncbi:MAG: hypothetical protein MJZ55_03920 [Paludibacteraceae bacterium]|nr:hypothetical protein [Paludibacteraceae bacterium]